MSNRHDPAHKHIRDRLLESLLVWLRQHEPVTHRSTMTRRPNIIFFLASYHSVRNHP